MRKCTNWIDTYLECVENQESPEVFHRWCALSALAATLDRNVAFWRGYANLYPNLYVVLVAESALSRKSTAIFIATSMLDEALPDLPRFSERESSPEAMLNALAEFCAQRGKSAGYIVADEMAMFIGSTQQDARIVSFLTQGYNSFDIYKYHSIGRGNEVCEKLYLNLLAGTTVEWLKTSLPMYAVAGGFTGRLIFVASGGAERRIPWPSIDQALRADLINDLQHIHENLAGSFEITDTAKTWFEDWYVHVYKSSDDPMLFAYYGRKGDSVFKLSMLLSVSKRDELVITEDEIEESISLLNTLEFKLPEVMADLEATEVGTYHKRVLDKLAKAGTWVKWSSLLRSFSHQMNTTMLSEVMNTLLQAELVEVGTSDTKAVIYRIREAKLYRGPHE